MQSYTKIYLEIMKMIQELVQFQDLEISLTPILRKVFLHLAKKQINALHGKLHLIKFTMIKLKKKLLTKTLG